MGSYAYLNAAYGWEPRLYFTEFLRIPGYSVLLRWRGLSDLIVAIDVSEDGATVIALVGAREHVLKSSGFLKVSKWVRHLREMGSDRRRTYLSAFPRRFENVKPFLEVVRVCAKVGEAQQIVDGLTPLLAIVDDKLYGRIRHHRKVRESRVRERHRRKLVLIADNLANYFRTLLKNNPKRFYRELNKFEK